MTDDAVTVERSTMPTLVVASRNPAKAEELARLLAEEERLAGVTVRTAADLDLPPVEEHGETFAANAETKARQSATAAGLPAVADDSGLVVEALGGAPGVRSARYAGGHGDDEANLHRVLEQMEGVTDRTARFVCAAALATPDGRAWIARGEVSGQLIDEPRGEGGFGYDPIFVPDGDTRTTAEMSPQEKDAISHRARALRALRGAIAEALER